MQIIALEFEHSPGVLAANGSDAVMVLDGRWKWDTCAEKILDKVALLRANGSKYNNMKFVGYTTLGNNWRGKCPQIEMIDPKS